MIHKIENGKIVSEQGAEQWIGSLTEYLADFGVTFSASQPPTLQALSAACKKRHDSWCVKDSVAQPGRDGTACASRPSPEHVLTTNWQSDPMNPEVCWRLKTMQELDTEKTVVASEALKLVASCLLEAVFDMKANPTNYPTAASLKQKALELYKARL